MLKAIFVTLMSSALMSSVFAVGFEDSIYIANCTTGAVADTAKTPELYGELCQIELIASGDLTNATVTIVAESPWSDMSDVTLYSSTNVVADTVIRPRFDGTDAAGAALTSDPPWPYVLARDKIELQVHSAAATNMNIRLRIKLK